MLIVNKIYFELIKNSKSIYYSFFICLMTISPFFIYQISLNRTLFYLSLFLILFFFFISIFIPYLNETFNHKLILFLSLFLPIFSEIVNSAIEIIVDLITLEYSEQAKRSKDVGSTLVLFSYFLVFLIWGFILNY